VHAGRSRDGFGFCGDLRKAAAKKCAPNRGHFCDSTISVDTHTWVQVSLTVFVDDIADAFEFQDVESALVLGRAQNERISSSLGGIGMKQNQEKQESLPICCGVGAHKTEASLLEGCGLDGKVLLAARYLGVRLTARFTLDVEWTFRLQAGRQAWASLSRFWTSDSP